TPAFRRVISLNDWMSGCAKVCGGVPARRVVAAADVSAGPADAKGNPPAAGLEAFLAASSTWCDISNGGNVTAALVHWLLLSSSQPDAPHLRRRAQASSGSKSV